MPMGKQRRPSQTFALVARGPLSQGLWNLEPVVPRALKADEVLVRIVASGVCLADVHFGDMAVAVVAGDEGDDDHAASDPAAVWYPRVLGHEGSGYVERVGSSVTTVKPADPVLLSYLSCGECYNCRDAHPAYCVRGFQCNFHGERGVYAAAAAAAEEVAPGSSSTTTSSFDIGGAFFGQSSFASRAIVKERSVVNLAKVAGGVSEEELRILAPLGCAVQTGTGAFTRIANVQSHHDVAVIGVGGVGQSAIMAAVMRGCKTIIAIDRQASRLELARALGATHTINTSDPTSDLVQEVLAITSGNGVHVSLDTTGVQSLARKSWDLVRNCGKILQVGLAKPDDVWDVSMADHMNSGKQIIGCVQGDSIPQEYVLEMIAWYRQGLLPLEKLVRFYPVAQYRKALQDMRDGRAIKPVLLWSPPPEPHM